MEQTHNCCKVGRVASDFGFQATLADLGERWAAEEGPGLRPLARTFNTRVVHERLLQAGNRSLDGEADLLYRLLTDDDVENAERARARQRLAELDIDPEKLIESFVSYRTIDRHFCNCTDRERQQSSAEPTGKKALERIDALKNRLERVTETALGQVADEREFRDTRTLDVMVQVNIACQDCGSRLSARKLLSDGCECVGTTHASSTPAAERVESNQAEAIPQSEEFDV